MEHLFNRIVVSTLVALSPAFAMAKTWIPSKATTFVLSLTPSSSNDLIACILSEKLPAKLDQPVIVDNRPGIIGLAGAASAARSAPDSHTIVILPSDIYMAPILTPKAGDANFDISKDFSPVLPAGGAPMLIVPSPSINVKMPRELVAYLRKNDTTSYGSPGTGFPMNITVEILERYIGTQIHHLPYRGMLPAVNVVLAGDTPHIATFKPVSVRLMERQRSELISIMSTMTESDIAGVETAAFFQILLPSATPAAAIQHLNTDISAVLATSEFSDNLRGMGVQITDGTPGNAAKLVRDTYSRNQQVFKDLNITVERATS